MSILALLANVVDFDIDEGGRTITIAEMCDRYFSRTLSKKGFFTAH